MVGMRGEHKMSDDEFDAFTGWRRVVVRMQRAGVRKAIKEKAHRKDRRAARQVSAEGQVRRTR